MSGFLGGAGGGLPAGGAVAASLVKHSVIDGDALWNAPLLAPTILAPLPLGGGTGVLVAVVAINPTTNASPAGATIVVAAEVGDNSASVVVSVTDTAGNVYVALQNTSPNVYAFYAKNALALAAGSTITVTASVADRIAVAAVSLRVVQANPLDRNTAPSHANGVLQSPVLSSGVLAQANEVILGITGTGRDDTVFSYIAPFVSVQKSQANNAESVDISYAVVYGNPSVNFQVTVDRAQTINAFLASFKG